MLKNVSFKQVENNFFTNTKPVYNCVKSVNPCYDCITFSAKPKKITKTIVTEQDIQKRVDNFRKIMGKIPIHEKVMTVLLNPELDFTVPDYDLKTNLLNNAKIAVNKVKKIVYNSLKAVLPDSLSTSIVNKINLNPLENLKTVAVSLNKVKVLDISEGPFDETGEVYFISLVTDGINPPTLLDAKAFEGIKKGDDLMDKGLQKPFNLYLSEEYLIPRLLDFRFLVMEDDAKNAKKAKDIVDKILNDKNYKSVMDAIKELIITGAPAAAIFTLVDAAISAILQLEALNEDDQLLYYAARFTKDFDNLGLGKYDKKYDKIELGYEIQGK